MHAAVLLLCLCSRLLRRAPAATDAGRATCPLTAQYCWKPPERSKKSATSCRAQSRSMWIRAAPGPCTGKPCCRRCHARAHTSNAVYRPLLHMRVKASHPPPTCSQEPSCWLRTGTPCVKEGLLRSPPMYDGSGVDVMRSRLDLRQAGRHRSARIGCTAGWLHSWEVLMHEASQQCAPDMPVLPAAPMAPSAVPCSCCRVPPARLLTRAPSASWPPSLAPSPG